MNERTAKYAAKPETLAVALGLRASGKAFKEFRAWLLGLKLRRQHGWEIEQLREEWAARQHRPTGGDGDLFDTTELKSKRLQSLARLWSAGKRLSDEEKAELRTAGLLSEGQNAKPTELPAAGSQTGSPTGPTVSLGDYRSLRALADALQLHYKGRIAGLIINPQTLNDWRKNDRLRYNPKPPIPPDCYPGNLWKGAEWVAWFDQWIFPHVRSDRINGHGKQGEIIDANELEAMRLRDEVERLQHDKRLRDIEAGLTIYKTEHQRLLTALGIHLNRFITERFERDMMKAFNEWIRASGLAAPERLAAEAGEQARRSADAFRAGLAAQLAELRDTPSK